MARAQMLSASGGDDKVAWYENLGGGFGPQQVITTAAAGAADVHVADLDGDGAGDVLSASINDSKIAWYENRVLDWRLVADQGTVGDFTLSLVGGAHQAPYFLFHSVDPANGTFPGLGWMFGLHMSLDDFAVQLTLAFQGNPLFGGNLSTTGEMSITMPATSVAFLSGETLWAVGIQSVSPGPATYEATSVQAYTFQ